MAQNDNNGAMLGLGLVAATVMVMLIFTLFIIQIGAIAFAAFSLLVVNRRYKIICGLVGLLAMALLTGPLQTLISNMYRELEIGMLIWSFHLAPWSILAIGFILTCLGLDFINDQRNQPTSEHDLLAWRIKWGFTKGLDLNPASSLQRAPDQNVFDVPPQDGT